MAAPAEVDEPESLDSVDDQVPSPSSNQAEVQIEESQSAEFEPASSIEAKLDHVRIVVFLNKNSHNNLIFIYICTNMIIDKLTQTCALFQLTTEVRCYIQLFRQSLFNDYNKRGKRETIFTMSCLMRWPTRSLLERNP